MLDAAAEAERYLWDLELAPAVIEGRLRALTRAALTDEEYAMLYLPPPGRGDR